MVNFRRRVRAISLPVVGSNMTLKNTQILSAAPGVHVGGNGFYLNVTANSAKSWIFRY